VDYIEDITYKIWEQGDLDYIYDTYSIDCPVYSLASCFNGTEVVVHNTRKTLDIFPDRVLFPADILWNGCNEGVEGDVLSGYHSSHLISTRMTYHHPTQSNPEDLEFPPECNGNRARIWVIAHCIIKNGLVVKEWLVRDNQGLYEQLGVCPDTVANKWAKNWFEESQICKLSHHAWLESEYQRVTETENHVANLDLNNVFPVSLREMYDYLGKYIVGKYKSLWGKEGMSSRSEFCKMLRSIYHPHARYDSCQGHDVVGYTELENLYDTFVLGGNKGEDVALAIDWVILKPGESTREGNHEAKNVWRYPSSEDISMQTDFFAKFKDAASAAETFTMAIRWTLVGKQKQAGGPSLPVVLLAESHVQCAGFRIIQDTTVYDGVALSAQLKLGKQLQQLEDSRSACSANLEHAKSHTLEADLVAVEIETPYS